MDISTLTSAAVETLQERESTGRVVTSITAEPVTDESGWISYGPTALITHHDGKTQNLTIRDTALSAALEEHANDEAELGSVPTVVIQVPLPTIAPNNRVRCEQHTGVHVETVACRWPHNELPDGPEPQVGHPLRVTD
ncbi:hypothetical protein [Streptomyces sp. NPDC002746]